MTRIQSPRTLLATLAIYFTVFVSAVVLLIILVPESFEYLPVGGKDAIEMAHVELEYVSTIGGTGQEITETRVAASESNSRRALVLVFLAESLAFAILIMLPIALTYMATRGDTGEHKTFAQALMVLPICATTIVLLIQGSLALAFGLAALVAAVRFRVRLREPVDGIYIFAAICVGLAAGIGYIGVAVVMAVFFCFANALMWSAGAEAEAPP